MRHVQNLATILKSVLQHMGTVLTDDLTTRDKKGFLELGGIPLYNSIELLF